MTKFVEFWDVDRDQAKPYVALITEKLDDGTADVVVFNRSKDAEYPDVVRRETGVPILVDFKYADPKVVNWTHRKFVAVEKGGK